MYICTITNEVNQRIIWTVWIYVQVQRVCVSSELPKWIFVHFSWKFAQKSIVCFVFLLHFVLSIRTYRWWFFSHSFIDRSFWMIARWWVSNYIIAKHHPKWSEVRVHCTIQKCCNMLTNLNCSALHLMNLHQNELYNQKNLMYHVEFLEVCPEHVISSEKFENKGRNEMKYKMATKYFRIKYQAV